MKQRIQAVKGTRDILPPESALWNRVEQTARQVLAAYNFQEIRLPLFEETELFARSVGADTDIVQKEMYSFEDEPPEILKAADFSFTRQPIRTADPQSAKEYLIGYRQLVEKLQAAFDSGDVPQTEHNRETLRRLSDILHRAPGNLMELPESERDQWIHFLAVGALLVLAGEVSDAIPQFLKGFSLALRPEATASVVRAYIEHGMHTRPGLAKLYYIGPMFRRERPQKGRFRQFYQIGAEVLGPSDHPAIDAEVIEMVLAFIERCGLKGCTLYLNSIGCGECRPKYVALLKEELQKVKSKLGADSQRRLETNPLRILDSKLEEEQAVIATLPSILDHLCVACREHFDRVKQELKERGIGFELNWRLVRGLDYYMRTTFEITAPGLGAQNAICGGGRYDGLVELLGGPPAKGIGWALGTDRFILALEQTGAAKTEERLDVFLIWLGAAAYARGRELARRLREAGLSVELPYEEMKLKKALGRADQLAARYALILGDNELAQNSVTVRELATGTQRTLPESDLLRELTASK